MCATLSRRVALLGPASPSRGGEGGQWRDSSLPSRGQLIDTLMGDKQQRNDL